MSTADSSAADSGSALTEGLGLVERLRLRTLVQHGGPSGFEHGWNLTAGDSELHRDAAAEIERLRAELAEAVTALPQAVRSERERCAGLCRRVADETRNSEDARSAGRMLANWISTGNPNEPGPNVGVEPPYSVGSNE